MLNAAGEIEGLSEWSHHKLERARHLARDLRDDLDSFGNGGNFFSTLEKHDDAFGADLVMHAREQPPTVEYSLRLGEIVHHTRSALDATLWEIAGLSGASATKRGMISYPANLHENDWDADRACEAESGKGLLNTLEATILERVRVTQPFAQDGDPKLDGLAAIARFSNYDKHRGMVVTMGMTTEIQMSLPLRRVKDPSFDNVNGDLHIATLQPTWEFVDGAHVLRFQWTVPMEIQADAAVNAPWAWHLMDPQLGQVFRIDDVFKMPEHASSVIHFVKTGEWP